MRLKAHILFLVILLSLMGRGYAQQMTTMGTDFWVTDVSGVNTTNSNPNNSIILSITAPRSCNVTITNTNTNQDTTIIINVPEIIHSYEAVFDRPNNSGFRHNYTFHIISTDSIALFAYSNNGGEHSKDKCLVLPTHLLRSRYIIQSYNSTQVASGFSVIASKDSTMVYVRFSTSTGTSRIVNNLYNFFIPNAGECLQFVSSIPGDFTGTLVYTENNKPIAVFQGHRDAFVGTDINTPNYSSTGALYEQSFSIDYWGRHFIVQHSNINIPDEIRITSSSNDCEVSINGQFTTILGERESYSYYTTDYSAADYIVTSKPSSVMLYTFSIDSGTTIIGPSMVTITPWEARTSECCFNANDFTSSMDRWLRINAKTSDTSTITLNNSSIAHYFTPIAYCPEFSQAKVPISDGFYHLISTSHEGFTGYAITESSWPSSFTLGVSLHRMRNKLNINGNPSLNEMDTTTVCANKNIKMVVDHMYDNDSIRWFFGDGTTATGDTVWHTYNNANLYQLTVITYDLCDTFCYFIDTLRTNINILPLDTTYTDTTVCGDSFFWQDSLYTAGSQFARVLQNRNGCDSTIITTLHFTQPTSGADTLYGCDSLLYNGNTYFSNDIVAFDTITNMAGCDSVLFHTIIINHSYDRTDNIIIRDTATLTWIDGNTYSESTNEPFVVLQARNGCDSTIHLHLTVLPTPMPPQIDSSAVWVPNAFTPGEDINNRFSIFCNDIITAEVSIFNRWGLHITTFDGLADSWDGTYKGTPCPQGAYVYLITYTTVSQPSQPQRVKGTVLLLR
ncbi:MAG: gliding motility-associated C-terminal domain-containing protein [Bacteroidales bacterium]|nr:gliding motility-associated C-terminal domain-containing protein [Bacteroidales bacterium]